jgi:hypothetical protein
LYREPQGKGPHGYLEVNGRYLLKQIIWKQIMKERTKFDTLHGKMMGIFEQMDQDLHSIEVREFMAH